MKKHRPAEEKQKPARADLLGAVHRTVPDVIAPGLRVLFVGINPGLYSAWSGHHFAKPGNRFWPALFAGGFTNRLLSPSEEHELLALGYGITNIVERASIGSADLSDEELVRGGKVLRRKLRRFRPQFVGVLGVSAFRVAFGAPEAKVGPYPQDLEGSTVWVLPNPSGLNAHFTPTKLAALFLGFRAAVE